MKKTLLITSLAGMAVVLFAQAPAPEAKPAADPAERVCSGGFDDLKPYGNSGRHWGADKDGVYCGWIGHGKAGDAAFAQPDTEVFVSKPCSMHMQCKDGKGCYLTYYFAKDSRLKPNTQYQVSFMIKLQDVKAGPKGGGIFLNVFTSHNNFFPKKWLTGTMDWTKQEFILQTDDKEINKDSKLQFNMWPGTTGDAWIDNVSVKELPAEKK